MSEKEPTYSLSGWKLSELFESFSDPAIDQAYRDLEARVEKFAIQREVLKPEIISEKFLQLLQEQEEMNKRVDAFGLELKTISDKVEVIILNKLDAASQ